MDRKIRTFVIEDDKMCCQAIKDFAATTDDIEIVAVAHDGVKAVELIPIIKPDVIVIDLALPNLDGFGVLQHISTLGLEITPVSILTTANSRASVSQMAFQLGVEYIMLKPYKVEDLMQRIRSVCKIALMQKNSQDVKQATTEYVLNKSLNYRIITVLNQFGVPSNRMGYQFLIDALNLVLESDDDSVGLITKRIYPPIARKYGTTESNVERAIRHVIERAWHNTDIDILSRLYGNSVNPEKGRPTNGEFICNVARKLRLEEMLG
ncbi:MAG: sporulation transcription factor Spo0A [Clostridiales bacterium]|jgi:two-component system response regulator (stage 0 sporulation protein A)|nr:sporulation transcription factor Spo0A [Clostridiales bacterium]